MKPGKAVMLKERANQSL